MTGRKRPEARTFTLILKIRKYFPEFQRLQKSQQHYYRIFFISRHIAFVLGGIKAKALQVYKRAKAYKNSTPWNVPSSLPTWIT